MANWNDAPILYFHFNTPNGGFASLPMRRVVRSFWASFIGVPGTKVHHAPEGAAEAYWLVPGYECLNCAKTFFTATKEDLRHECMNNTGVISGKA